MVGVDAARLQSQLHPSLYAPFDRVDAGVLEAASARRDESARKTQKVLPRVKLVLAFQTHRGTGGEQNVETATTSAPNPGSRRGRRLGLERFDLPIVLGEDVVRDAFEIALDVVAFGDVENVPERCALPGRVADCHFCSEVGLEP